MQTQIGSITIAAALVGWLSAVSVQADSAALKYFETEIRPLLVEHCQSCHGPDKSKGGLRLDTAAGLKRGSTQGPVVQPGEPDLSALIQAVRRTDPDLAMPPKEPLPAEAVAKLEEWVRKGAEWPEMASSRSGIDAHGFTAEDRAWWAVQPVRDPKVPGNGEGWARSPIDRFIAKAQEQAGLHPAAEADRRELVRRAYFDLHGLPPTPAQIQAFVQDQRPDAWERLIDSLLDSPRYGERWAQHWLDVVRYSESDGYRQDAYRPEAYHYRDYVVRSFNQDKPYDQFVKEQLAGDEWKPSEPDALIATGFLRHGIYEYNQRNARMHWELIINEMTSVTGETFLGLGMGCAQCHDHKFDPILQKDYYSLQAFLSSTVWPTDRLLGTPAELREYRRKQNEWEAATQDLRAELDTLIGPIQRSKETGAVSQFPEDIQEMYNKPRDQRTPYEQQLVMLVERQVEWSIGQADYEKSFAKKPEQLARYKAIQEELKQFDSLKPKPLPTAFLATDVGTTPTRTFISSRSGKTEVGPAFLTLMNQPVPQVQPGSTTTGRRTALAEWITRPENPFSTRVMANRIWQHHFGTGIVPTPNDFGTLGELPSHPELLDWLTVRFVENGWKLKPVHRLIMLSATYRQTALREPSVDENSADPDNRLLWRFSPRRLSAEEIRDAMLAVSGELKQRGDGPSESATSPVRSVFVKKYRNTPDAVLGGFDAPMGFDSAPTRIATTTPTQSLLLLNGPWTMKRAESLATRVVGNSGEFTEAMARSIFLETLGREPAKEELQSAMSLVRASAGAVIEPDKEDPYPNENGLRPISQMFGKAKGVKLGEGALWIQPGSRFERLQVPDQALKGDEFTLETVVVLDRLYKDASVNSLVSRWNGNSSSHGWCVGVTSEKSRYQPRNFIVQLIGEDAQGDTTYEVVASDLRVPLNTPVYLAVQVSARRQNETGTTGTVTFFMKDLSDPKAPLQTRTVTHSVVRGIQNPEQPVLLGGRHQTSHQWDGQIARFAVSQEIPEPDQLLVADSPKPLQRNVDWIFPKSPSKEESPVEGSTWMAALTTSSKAKTQRPANWTGVVDLCHALLSSNEFLYLH